MGLKQDMINARALIEAPEHWCKGRLTKALASGGLASCAVGAMDRACGGFAAGKQLSLLHRSLPEAFTSISTFNDDPNTTHADVLALFDRAISAAES